jgi:predicted transcriptional regulator of viral defense system
MPYSKANSKINTFDFFVTHPVFSLKDAAHELFHQSNPGKAVERLKHHLEKGRLKLVTRGVYAVVPAGIPAKEFRPDPFLIAAAIRPDAVFSHHSALELLGAGHSLWSQLTLYTMNRRSPLKRPDFTIQFLAHPKIGNRMTNDQKIGVRTFERLGKLLKATGPERTLIEGFRRPALAGGLAELVESASGFATLDLSLVNKILELYDVFHLWAAMGWFLDTHRKTFQVAENYLKTMEKKVPQSPQYLDRRQRGGEMSRRWNLIIPLALKNKGAGNEP